MSRLDVVAPKLPRSLPHGGLKPKVVTEWKNFIDTLSGSKGTDRSRAIALRGSKLSLLDEERPREFGVKEYLKKIGYRSPSTKLKEKKSALKEFSKKKGSEAFVRHYAPSTTKESKELMMDVPEGRVHVLEKPQALKQRKLARQGKLAKIPEKPTGWLGGVSSFLDLFRDTEGVEKFKTRRSTPHAKSLFIAEEVYLAKGTAYGGGYVRSKEPLKIDFTKQRDAKNVGGKPSRKEAYTYGVGEEEGKEWKAHLAKQEAKIADYWKKHRASSTTLDKGWLGDKWKAAKAEVKSWFSPKKISAVKSGATKSGQQYLGNRPMKGSPFTTKRGGK